MMKPEDEWNEDDATWQLLGKSAPEKPRGRFVDDTVRAVRLLPEADPWWPKILTFSPWAAVAACGVLAAFFLVNAPEKPAGNDLVSVSDLEENWVEIEAVADAEMLAAAAEDLDSFSDYELVTLIGF